MKRPALYLGYEKKDDISMTWAVNGREVWMSASVYLYELSVWTTMTMLETNC